jgi:hypothetical protein
VKYHYLSFASTDGWRGGVVVLAVDFTHAVRTAAALGINPGGAVEGFELDGFSSVLPPEGLENRLITDRDELDRLCEQWISDLQETAN